jgi:hypothetical protein
MPNFYMSRSDLSEAIDLDFFDKFFYGQIENDGTVSTYAIYGSSMCGEISVSLDQFDCPVIAENGSDNPDSIFLNWCRKYLGVSVGTFEN